MNSQNFRGSLSQAIQNSAKYAWVFYLVMFLLLLSLQVTLFNPDIISKELATTYILPTITALALIPLTAFAYQKFSSDNSDANIFVRCIICKSAMEPIGKWSCTNPDCNGKFSNEKDE